MLTERTCSIDGCVKPGRKRGWCVMHYERWKRNGDPLKVQQIRGDHVARLMSHVRIDPSGCWIWTGLLNASGYGRMGWQGSLRLAHRVSYALLKGPLVEGLDIDHLCRVRPCVNPDHLEQVERQVNLLRARLARDATIGALVRTQIAAEIDQDVALFAEIERLADSTNPSTAADKIQDAVVARITRGPLGPASFETMPATVPEREGVRV